jgi:hypothetical protein
MFKEVNLVFCRRYGPIRYTIRHLIRRLKHDERSEVGSISSGSLLLVNHLVYSLIFFYLYV